MLVGRLRQRAQDAVEVGRGREQLVHQRHAPAGERRLGRQRHHGRAGEAGIDQLAAGQALAVGRRPRAPRHRRRAPARRWWCCRGRRTGPRPSARAAKLAEASQLAEATSAAPPPRLRRRRGSHAGRPTRVQRAGPAGGHGRRAAGPRRWHGPRTGRRARRSSSPRPAPPGRSRARSLGQRGLEPVEALPERAGQLHGRHRPGRRASTCAPLRCAPPMSRPVIKSPIACLFLPCYMR